MSDSNSRSDKENMKDNDEENKLDKKNNKDKYNIWYMKSNLPEMFVVFPNGEFKSLNVALWSEDNARDSHAKYLKILKNSDLDALFAIASEEMKIINGRALAECEKIWSAYELTTPSDHRSELTSPDYRSELTTPDYRSELTTPYDHKSRPSNPESLIIKIESMICSPIPEHNDVKDSLDVSPSCGFDYRSLVYWRTRGFKKCARHIIGSWECKFRGDDSVNLGCNVYGSNSNCGIVGERDGDEKDTSIRLVTGSYFMVVIQYTANGIQYGATIYNCLDESKAKELTEKLKESVARDGIKIGKEIFI